jgi:hypothetical protein
MLDLYADIVIICIVIKNHSFKNLPFHCSHPIAVVINHNEKVFSPQNYKKITSASKIYLP